MSRFTGPLVVSFSEGRYALLKEPLVWEIDEKGSGREIVVPAGFISDGASVPRELWWFMPPWGSRGSRAAILHDYILYRIAKRSPVDKLTTRADADKQFRLALLALGVPIWRAFVLWSAVRAFSIYCRTKRCLRSPLDRIM